MVGAREGDTRGARGVEHVRDWQEEDYGGTGGINGGNTSGEVTGPPGDDSIQGGLAAVMVAAYTSQSTRDANVGRWRRCRWRRR